MEYDVDIDSLWNYVELSFIESMEREYGENIRSIYEDSFTLEGKHYWYYGGNGTDVDEFGSDYLNISYYRKLSFRIARI